MSQPEMENTMTPHQRREAALAPLTTAMLPLTSQQAFDRALFGIRAQGYKQSLRAPFDYNRNPNPYDDFEDDPAPDCAYRGLDGLKCAVGHCLPDEFYLRDMEGMPSRRVVDMVWFGHRVDMIEAGCANLLSAMQSAHDKLLPRVRVWEERMAGIAHTFSLIYTEVQP